MQRIASGDNEAFEELLNQHGAMLARLVGRILAWNSDCDDVLQDVLMTVWQRASTYRGRGSLEGWLRKMAVNQCRNRFRSMMLLKRKISQLALILTTSRKTANDDPIYTSTKHNLAVDPELQVALGELPLDDRTAIVLYYLEEQSGEEVAATLGVSPGDVICTSSPDQKKTETTT